MNKHESNFAAMTGREIHKDQDCKASTIDKTLLPTLRDTEIKIESSTP